MSKCCCCSDGPSLADDPRFVFSIYAIAFIPLASIYALDFITDKWRTIRDTRRNGMVQLLVSLPSLAFVIFYIVTQIKNRDYKEAAAAIAVAVFNSYHVLRTIWGLILLYEFRNWNIYALRCLASVGYLVPVYGYSDDVKNMVSKVKSCGARWKRPLIRLFNSLKTRFMYAYNGLLCCTHPVSSLHASVRSTSPSSAISNRSTVDPSGVSHEANSCSTSSGSTTDGSHSHQLLEQNSFSSVLPEDSIVDSQTRPFLLFGCLKTSIRFLFSAFQDPNGFRKDVKKLSTPLYNWVMGNMEVVDSSCGPSLEEIKRTADHHMVVNSSLIDNEFTSAELPVRLALFSRVVYRDPERHSDMARFVASCLKSTKPEECSVRWLVSFLARFGCEWLVDTKVHSNKPLTALQRYKRWSSLQLGVLGSAHTTQGSVKGNGSTESFVTLFSPYHRYCTGDANYLDGEIDITQRCMLPFKMNTAFEKTFRFSMHKATIRDAAKDDWHKTSLNELKDAQRSAVENITGSQLALFAVLMENVELVNKDDTVLSDINTGRYGEAKDRSMDTLMYQLGSDPGEDFEQFFGSLPVRKAALSSFLWDNNPSSLLLQASVHVDNYLALKSGDRLDAFVEEWQAASQAGASERTTSVFENQYNLEMRRLQLDVTSLRGYSDIGRFIGCVTESVRSTLATWVVENDSEADGWNASIAPVDIKFLCSKQLCSSISEARKIGRSEEEMQGLHMSLIWEVQSHLQWKVGDEVVRNVGDIRQSRFLIMLFVLGFPRLKVEALENEGTVSGSNIGDSTIEFEYGITVRPVAGPQKLRLLLKCNEESKTVSVIFSPESLVFHWQEWRDAFMGRVAAQRHWRMTRLSSNNELLRTEKNHLDISAPVLHIGPEELGKEYGLSFWSGWPPFMPQIAQFEIRNMVEDEHGAWDVEHFAERSSEFIGALNNAIDIHMEQTTDVETLYTDGCDAMEGGRGYEALRQFGRCIAEHGHREALKDAFGVISRKNTKCDSQVDALQKQMDVRFRTLLNRSHIEEQNRPVDEIDLVMLANYFGRIYELTGSEDALKRKAVSLFYENGGNSTVSEKAIHAIESFINREGRNFGDSSLSFYLAVAHQSVFHESQDQAHQEIAAKCMVGLRSRAWDSDPADCFNSNIGYLLEKGSFVGRDAKRMNAIIETICERDECGDGKMLLAIVGRLFVKQSASDVSSNEVIGNERVFGIGIRPKDAISVYLNPFVFLPKCTNRLGLLYHKGAQDIPADVLKAGEKYSASIEKGNHDALCNMGVLKCDNTGDNGGISFLKRAVEAGCSSGMNNLAMAFEVGNGINRDVLEAERLYKQSIEVDNNPVAMYNLAILYMWGDTEVQNDENLSASLRLISELMSPETELEPLYTLQEQVRRAALLRGRSDETVSTRKVEVEELDECLVYVKILESCGTGSVPGDEKCLEVRN